MRSPASRLLAYSFALLTTVAAAVQAGQVCDPAQIATIGGRSWGLAIDGDLAFVANADAGLHIYDISDPTSPIALSVMQTGQWAVGVAVQDGIACVAALENGLQVVDVSTPTAPALLETVEVVDRASDVALAGNLCYFGDGAAGIRIIDISDPGQAVELGAVEIPGGYARRVSLAGDLLFVAAGNAGLSVIDVSNSSAPVVIGTYATPSYAYDVAIVGNTAYVVDDDGLHNISVVEPASPTLVNATLTNNEPRAVAIGDGLVYVAQRGTVQAFNPTGSLGIVQVASLGDNVVDGTDIVLRDGMAYVLDDDAGLQIYDVKKPSTFVPIGTADLINEPEGVAVDGDTLAIVDFDYGLQLMDVSDPSSPQPLGKFAFQGADGGVEIKRNVVYAGDSEVVEILDISDPMNPVHLSTLEITSATDMKQVGDLLYVASSDNPDLSIIDVSDPSKPVVLGALSLGGRSYDLAVVGDLVYIANGNRQLQIVDVSDPAVPVLLTSDASVRGHGKPGAFARGVDVRGDYAYVAAGAVGMQVYYVADPANPVLLTWESTSGGARDVEIVGSRAFVQGGPDLVVYDLTNPHSPQEVGYGDTDSSGAARSLAVGNDAVYVARDYGGLAVFDIDTCIPAGPADISGDGVVDATDLAILVAAWGTGAPAADLDGDGVVGTSDLAILLAAWS